MFPLLTELYLPVLNVPIFCNSDDQTLSEDSLDLLIQIENAAKNKESVILPESKRKIADVLQQNGFPIRISSKNEKFLSICLIGCVSHSCDVDVSYKDYPTEPVSHGVAEKVRHFCTTNMESVFENNSSDFWSLIDADVSFYVFLCIEDKSEKWPDEESEYNPPWFNLPDKKSLMDVGKPRSLSPTTDEKLLILCNHNLFGFIIQIFLLEALDRELGEETLILAPPIHYRSDNLEAETHIFYQPRASRGPEGKLIRQPSFDIGQIDETFSMLGNRLGIKGICFPYLNETIGPWSFATKLLRDAGVIVGYHDRWTIASHVLDRLHGGGLMTKVIRRGRNFREKIHRDLLNIWDMQKTEKQQEKELG
jgi:hypothetical protein